MYSYIIHCILGNLDFKMHAFNYLIIYLIIFNYAFNVINLINKMHDFKIHAHTCVLITHSQTYISYVATHVYSLTDEELFKDKNINIGIVI